MPLGAIVRGAAKAAFADAFKGGAEAVGAIKRKPIGMR
jgi:hypothetical protein